MKVGLSKKQRSIKSSNVMVCLISIVSGVQNDKTNLFKLILKTLIVHKIIVFTV